MKNDRRRAILEIVSNYEVDTQETLQALLLDKGYSVTQATVSRDIKQLSLLKTAGSNGRYKYTIPQKPQETNARLSFKALYADSVVSTDRAVNIIVIKCYSGMANAVCSKLDEAAFSGVVGTIAGDDTIFVLMRDEKTAISFAEELDDML